MLILIVLGLAGGAVFAAEAVDAVGQPASMTPAQATLPAAGTIALLVWVLTFALGKILPSVSKDRIAMICGTVLGLLAQIFGLFPPGDGSTLQTVLAWVLAILSGLAGGVGSGLIHDYGFKALTTGEKNA